MEDNEDTDNCEDFLYDLFAVVNNCESENKDFFEMYAFNHHKEKWWVKIKERFLVVFEWTVNLEILIKSF